MPKKKSAKVKSEEKGTENTTEQETVQAAEEKTEQATAETEAQTSQDDELKKLKDELAAQKDVYLRLAAEYDNFRKRTEREKVSTYDNALSKAVETFLPVADSLSLAVSAQSGGSDDYRKGLEMIAKLMEEALKKINVEAFGAIGDAFNPELHNAVSQVENAELCENSVAAVFQKGYKIGDKVIRHAMVQVANC